MTTQTEPSSESGLLRSVAERYRKQGYDVLVEPRGKQRPDFLSSFQPDMIARRGDEAVVVELKRRPPGVPDPQLRKLASEIARHPGWRLDLVLGENLTRSALATLSTEQLFTQLDEGIALCRNGHVAAGMLLVWASFEGIARLAAAREGIDVSPTEVPLALVRRLVSEGLLEDDEYTVVRSAIERRNGVAHGFAAVSEDRDAFERLGAIAHRLLSESQPGG